MMALVYMGRYRLSVLLTRERVLSRARTRTVQQVLSPAGRPSAAQRLGKVQGRAGQQK